MKKVMLMLALILAIVSPVAALDYEDKPYFVAYISGSNYIDAGKDNTVVIVLQNNARLWKQIYDSYEEYQFFSENPEMLITAYNVTVSFESDTLKIKTPEMKFSALPPFKPLQIPVVVDTRGVKYGEHYITVKIKYEVVDELILDMTTPEVKFLPYQESTTINSSGAVTKTIVNESQVITYPEYQKLKFEEKTQEIKLKVVVERPEVSLKVVNVTSDITAGGKGKIVLTITNDGYAKAENLFVTLTTPPGFVVSGLKEVDVKKYTSALQKLLGSQFIPISVPEIELPPELQTILTKSAVFVGDLAPGQNVTITFSVEANTDEGGVYPFQIRGIYTSDDEVKQTNAVTFGVEVRDKPKIVVEKVISNVYAGSKGDVVIKIKSDRPLKSLKAKLEVKPPLTALSEEYFAGDVSEAELKFKVKASTDAENTVYPAKLTLFYDLGGKEASDSVDVGIEVKEKVRFEVIGKGVLEAGKEGYVTVKVKNLGAYEIREATARITVVDPFSTTDDTSYIGDLKPGEAKNVTFKLKVDGDATPKTYALNLEVKYKDLNDEWVISEPVKLPIEVKASKRIPGFELSLALLSMFVLLWRRK